MNLSEIWLEIEAVSQTSSMYDVFEHFRSHRDWPFLPVVDEHKHVLGVVREYDLKGHAYARFGRDLMKRHSLQDFMQPTLVLPVGVKLEELLDASEQNPNPDGIVLTAGGKYRAVLVNRAVLRLFEKHHQESQARLAQCQKMEAIGTLAGGIAHDLNNILTPIQGYAELMTLMRKQGEPINQEMIDEISVSTLRAKEIVKQILAFSRHQNTERHPMSLGKEIKDVARLLRASLPATMEMEVRMNTKHDRILANPEEMHRVVMNLCTNAYHAMRKSGGRMQVTLDLHHGPVLGWSMHGEFLLGDYLRLSVADTGSGIEPALLPRIFEPFFTTKKQNEGTGLGLPIVHGIVSRCKGVISVESEVGKGSTFHLYFPLLEPAGKEASAPALPEAPGYRAPLMGEPQIKILFVDDEFAITRLASIILPKYGICVVPENDSHKALLKFREQAGEFDLLVTDQTMPGLTGVDLTREVLQIRPTLPVILCTGYSESVSPDEAKKAGVCEYMLKPPDFQQMAGVIQRLVGQHPLEEKKCRDLFLGLNEDIDEVALNGAQKQAVFA